MKRFLFGWLAIAAVGSCLGCGGSAGGSADSAQVDLPTAPQILVFSVSPSGQSIDIGGSVLLLATAYYSDSTSHAVDATWTSIDGAIVSLSSNQGAEVLATGLTAGTGIVEATYLGVTAQVAVHVLPDVPADPGILYGTDESGSVFEYPAFGGGAPTIKYTAPGYARSFMLDRTSSSHFIVTDSPEGYALFQIDLATLTVSNRVTLPQENNGYFGIDYDSADRIYMRGFGNGQLLRFDPGTGDLDAIGSAVAYQIDLSIGPDDTMYSSPLLTSPGTVWIYRYDPATDSMVEWANAPVAGNPNGLIPGGLSINRRGEAFTGDMIASDVYRYVDVNGDGDATDAGEAVVFGSMPATTYVSMYGISAAGGLDSVVVNFLSENGSECGIYWLRDLDGDGLATNPGEVTIYNPWYLSEGLNTNCIVAPK